MRHATNVGLVTGPLVLLGYLLGSLSRWRDPRTGEAPARLDPRLQAALDVVLVLAAATAGWHVSKAVAPGVTFSRVASLSSQVLFAWESVALWCGLAAVLGHVAPVWSRFRDGGSGLHCALALTAVHAPVVFVLATASFAIGTWLLRSTRRAVPLALGTTVAGSWVLWVRDVAPAWGSTNGPELTLWVTAGAGILFTRWLRGDVLAPPPSAGPQDQ